jgi:hypothetical protein
LFDCDRVSARILAAVRPPPWNRPSGDGPFQSKEDDAGTAESDRKEGVVLGSDIGRDTARRDEGGDAVEAAQIHVRRHRVPQPAGEDESATKAAQQTAIRACPARAIDESSRPDSAEQSDTEKCDRPEPRDLPEDRYPGTSHEQSDLQYRADEYRVPVRHVGSSIPTSPPWRDQYSTGMSSVIRRCSIGGRNRTTEGRTRA